MKTPRPYQQTAIDYMAEHNTYLCDACGLGKTLMSIQALIECGYAQGTNLVICRKSAKLQWKREIEDQVPNATVELTNHLPWNFGKHRAWYITHYDELTPKSILYPVGRHIWDGIIIDEAHKLRTHNIARTKNIINITGARKIALSATPIEHNGSELWGVLRWLDHDHFPAYWTWTYKYFEVKQGFWGGFEIGDPISTEAYRKEVAPYMIRRSKVEVAPDLPQRVDIEVPVQMDSDQFNVYTVVQEQRDVIVKIQDQELLITNALTLFTRLHQISTDPALLNIKAPSAKTLWVQEFVEDHPDMRLLIFTRYRGMVEILREKLKRYGVFVVMQGTNEAERFQKGEGRLLVGTIDSMSESLSLEMADAAIFVDQHWSTTQMQQAVDRIHRMNIISKKFIYYLIGSDADQYVMDVVNGKLTDQQMLLEWLHGRVPVINPE